MNEQTSPLPGRGRPTRLHVYERLHAQIAELWGRLGGLPNPLEARDIWRGIWYEEAHHSTAIEGNTLALKQVELLLDEGRAVGNKVLREYLEVRGYADAADWVYEQARNPTGTSYTERLLTLAEVRETHRAAMQPVWDVAPHPDATERETPGNFREHEIGPFPEGMTPISWPLVHAEMSTWVQSVNDLGTKLGLSPWASGRFDDSSAEPSTLPEGLAGLHCRFEQIHPFLDGNGRTGRLLLNLVLVRLGFPPVIIYKRDRRRYLRALQRADAGEPGPLGELLARSMLGTLYRFVIPAVAGPVRLVPLAALGSLDMKAPALRAAAARGRLQAVRGSDGQWHSTRKWVDAYKDSRWERA